MTLKNGVIGEHSNKTATLILLIVLFSNLLYKC
jgi:hypothetical protein